MNQTAARIIRWLIVLAMPFFVGLSGIRLAIAGADSYLRYQYFNPNFPADRFGLSPEERLALARVAVDYLQRREPAEQVIYLLEEQRLPGGDQPLYNEREIDHMIDVKNVADAIGRVVALSGLIVIIGLAALLAQPETRRTGYQALLNGGVFTTAVLLAIAAFILIGWDLFFVQFHELLFPPGSWQFAFDDGLIRLFPEKFWFDIGIVMSLLPLFAGLITAGIGYWLVNRAR